MHIILLETNLEACIKYPIQTNDHHKRWNLRRKRSWAQPESFGPVSTACQVRAVTHYVRSETDPNS